MFKNYIGLLIALFLFARCATYNNARKYYDKHPDVFAMDCAGDFVATDSVGEAIITVTPGNSVDYTGTIDSLAREADQLYTKAANDSVRAASISQDCASLVSGYRNTVRDLTARIGALNANYKKPTPDTFRIEIPTFRVPMQTVAKLKYNEHQIDSLDKALAIVTSSRDDFKGKARKRIWIIGGLCVGIGILTVLRFKNII